MDTLEQQIIKQTKTAISNAVKKQLTGYNSPLGLFIDIAKKTTLRINVIQILHNLGRKKAPIL